MNPLIPSLIALALTATLAAPAHAARVKIDPARARAYFVYPLSNTQSLDASWIEIVGCEEKGSPCRTLIDRIRVVDLKTTGGLALKLGKLGFLTITLKGGEGKETEIARIEPKSGWYPRTELCLTEGVEPACRYAIFRDEATRSLTLKLTGQE